MEKSQIEKQRVETIKLPKRSFTVKTDKRTVSIGSGQKLSVIAGPCVVEDRDLMINTARRLVEICDRLDVGLIFKSSYEKRQSRNRPQLEGSID